MDEEIIKEDEIKEHEYEIIIKIVDKEKDDDNEEKEIKKDEIVLIKLYTKK